MLQKVLAAQREQGLFVSDWQLKFCQSDAGEVGEGYLSVYHFHSLEEVVGDQQVTVQVGKVCQWGQLGCR